MVLMVPLLIMATSLVSKINTRVALVKGWVNSFLAFMGQVYIGFYNGHVMAIIEADVKPVPHRHIGMERATQHIGIEGIMGAKRLRDGSCNLHNPNVITFGLIAPDHEGLQTLHEGILNPWVNPFLDGDFFI